MKNHLVTVENTSFGFHEVSETEIADGGVPLQGEANTITEFIHTIYPKMPLGYCLRTVHRQPNRKFTAYFYKIGEKFLN